MSLGIDTTKGLNLSPAEIIGSRRLGPSAGFYPVSGIEGHELQLWVPEPLQSYESRCLAKIVRESGVEYDRIFALSRGGFMAGGILAYANGHKRLHGIQSFGYDENNQPLKTPQLAGTPDLKGLPRGESLLIVDDLIEEGSALHATKTWLAKHLNPKRVDTAVIYDKDHEHILEVDYSVRKVPGLWLDHENQAQEDRRIQRLQELAPYITEMVYMGGWLSMQPADQHMLRALVEQSDTSGFYAGGTQ